MDIQKHQIPTSYMDKIDFDKLWRMKPTKRSKVFNAECTIDAHRWYESYGETPTRNPEAWTYMFAGQDKTKFDGIPEVFVDIMNYLNNTLPGPNYNQLVVNWYDSKDDYCPKHRDCLKNMTPGATVSIVNIVEDVTMKPRELVFYPGHYHPQHRISCNNGLCVTFGGVALNTWRHGVPKAKGPVSRRISLSFRSYL